MKCIDPWLLKNKRVCPQCRKKVFASGEVPPSDTESETEDERAPLLARPRLTQGGTFATQNENPFRRAARRLARRGGGAAAASTSQSGESSSANERPPIRNFNFGQRNAISVRSSSPGGNSSDSSSTEGGTPTHHSHNSQLVTQVYIEQQSRMPTSPTPSSPIPPPQSPTPHQSPPATSPPPSSSPTGASNDAFENETGVENNTDETVNVTVHDTPEVLTVVVDVENNYVDEDNDIDQAPTVQHTNETGSNEDPIV